MPEMNLMTTESVGYSPVVAIGGSIGAPFF
jgi:hypothetical protein